MNQMLTALFVLGMFFSAKAAPEANPQQPKSRTVSVSGSAVGYMPPDAVLWTVTRESTGKSLAEAKENNEQEVKKLVDACTKKGIQGADMSLGMVKIQDGSASGTPTRFSATRTVTFRQREMPLFQEILDLVSNGDGKVKYSLYCSKTDKITRDTMVRATQAAKDKAAAMATVLGATLGPVQSINEYPPIGSTTRDENVPVDESSIAFTADVEKIRITVYVTFELQ